VTDKVPTEAAIWLARIERGLQPQEGVRLREWLQPPSIGTQSSIPPSSTTDPTWSRCWQNWCRWVLATCLALLMAVVPFITIKP
jgi:hypothetical protein